MSISQQELDNLRTQGYSNEEIQNAILELEQDELNNSFQQTQQKQMKDPRQFSKISAFSTKPHDDIVRWQLDLNNLLERIEHILRGDIPKFREGHIIWEDNPSPENNYLNVIGVQEVLKILSMYINPNTILSDYTPEEIRLKVYDFGIELNDEIYKRYDQLGMDVEEKRKSYPMLIRMMVDVVHSAYKRALEGGERESLRKIMNVSQATNTQATMGSGVTITNQGYPQKERGLLNPLRYIKGRYIQ